MAPKAEIPKVAAALFLINSLLLDLLMIQRVLPFWLLQWLDFDVFVADLVSMILKKNTPFFGFSEIWPHFIFTDGYQVAVFFGASYIFDHFDTVDIVLDSIVRINYDSALIPFPWLSHKPGLLIGFDQVIERS
jgi:hypothetical protein